MGQLDRRLDCTRAVDGEVVADGRGLGKIGMRDGGDRGGGNGRSMKAPTEAQIRAMTPEGRLLVRSRAAKLGTEVGNVTVALIDSLNLPMSSGGMSLDDPTYLEMQAIVWSAASKAAAIEAVEQGMPALAGVDPLLQNAMGSRYSRNAQGTMNAGSLVAEIMRHQGYEKVGEGSLPQGCIARTGATWRLVTAR